MPSPSHGLGTGGIVSSGLGRTGKSISSTPTASWGHGHGHAGTISSRPPDYEAKDQWEVKGLNITVGAELNIEEMAENEVKIIDLRPVVLQEQIREQLEMLKRQIAILERKEESIQRQMEQLTEFQGWMFKWLTKQIDEIQAIRTQVEKERANLIQPQSQPQPIENKAQSQSNILMAIGIGSIINIGIIALSRLLK